MPTHRALFLTLTLLLALATTGRTADPKPGKAICAVCAARATHGDPKPEKIAGQSVHEGVTYSFCSKPCKKEFDAEPDWWIPLELPVPLPELRLRNLEGSALTRRVTPGAVTVVDFWATWCKPCEKIMRHLNERHASDDPSKVNIIGISIDEGDDALAKVGKKVRKAKLSYPIYLDDLESPTWSALKVHAVPATFLVDGSGQIVKRWVGPLEAHTLDAAIVSLVAAQEN